MKREVAQVPATFRLGDLRDLGTAVERVRRLLDADCDPVAVDEAFSGDPLVGPLVRRTPGLRVPGHVDGPELAVRALADFHRRYDLLLTPTIAEPPPLIGAHATPAVEQAGARLVLALRAGRIFARLGVVQQAVRRNLAWVPYTPLANLTGRPAASVPRSILPLTPFRNSR